MSIGHFGMGEHRVPGMGEYGVNAMGRARSTMRWVSIENLGMGEQGVPGMGEHGVPVIIEHRVPGMCEYKLLVLGDYIVHGWVKTWSLTCVSKEYLNG